MKKIFLTVYILTVLDIILTVTGIRMDYITEANPILQGFMHNYPILTGTVMCALVGAVLYGVYRVRHKIRWLGYAMGGMMAVKVVIIGIHVGWIIEMVRAL
jgi:hypothetical protein